MKNIVSIIYVLLLACAELAAREEVAELSYFRLQGQVELRSVPSFSQEALACRSLNHEGGLAVRVLEKGARDGRRGRWLFVVTTVPFWNTDGGWVPAGARFWLFLGDEEELFDYEP